MAPAVGHPAVAKAAVVGATDAQTGQAICAFVILKAGAHGGRESMVEQLRAEVAREISRIAKPREIHGVPELPKTRSGKIMRRLLRDVVEGRELGDTSILVDPSVFEAIRANK
jgi:acetyl-CoA synthetase